MKNIFKGMVVVLMFLIFMPSSTIIMANEKEFEIYDSRVTVFEYDRMLHGDIIDKEIVVYDESLNFYNPAYYDSTLNTIATKGIDLVDLGGVAPYYMKYFTRISWTSRTGGWSLSLTPKNGNVGKESQVWNSIKNIG